MNCERVQFLFDSILNRRTRLSINSDEKMMMRDIGLSFTG